MRTRNEGGYGKRYSLSVRDIYGIGSLSFLAALIATALLATEGSGVAVVQIHTGYVQGILVAFQDYAPHLFLLAVHAPLAKVPIHGLVVQHRPSEDG